MTPAELIARLELSSKCDSPTLTRDLAKEMLGAAKELRRTAGHVSEAVNHMAELAAHDIDRTESIACAWAFDLGRETDYAVFEMLR